MRFNLTKPFAGALTSVAHADPWGNGITFWVRPITHPPFQDSMREGAQGGGSADDIMQKAIGRASKRWAALTGPRRDSLSKEEAELTFESVFAEAYQSVVFETPEGDFVAKLNASAGRALPAEKVVLLIEHADGLTADDEPVDPCDAEAHIALLNDGTTVPLAHVYAGMTVGFALRVWLVEKAREAANSLAAVKETAEGESEGSCDTGLPS
jgi:hypothetical protein